jgi:hypothetical protein
VEDSMENLEIVVRERNRAYYELETGDSGKRLNLCGGGGGIIIKQSISTYIAIYIASVFLGCL